MKKILIIGNETFLEDFLEDNLRGRGYEVVKDFNGAAALQKIREFMPELLVIRARLANNISALSILQAKAKDESIKKIPVIVISDTETKDEAEKYKGLPVVAHIEKASAEPDKVVEKIDMTFVNLFSKKPLAGKKVLWVEDDPFLSSIVTKKFSKYETVFSLAKNSAEAYEILKKETPDIIILDILLPGENGFDILQNLKKDEKTRGVPVVILSNLGEKGDVEKGEALGAKKFLVKALYTLDKIVDEIVAVMEKS